MSKIQPPPGYVSTPPSEPGWYRVWCADCPRRGPFKVMEVWRGQTGDLRVNNGLWFVTEVDCFWGLKVEF